MRKLSIVIILLFANVLWILLLSEVPAFAQSRGALRNVYASWVNVTTDQHTISLPYNSRDVFIQNGSTSVVCVSPNGKTIQGDCRSAVDSYVFQLDGDSDVYLSDFVTDSITMRTVSGTASPVSVIVTY